MTTHSAKLSDVPTEFSSLPVERLEAMHQAGKQIRNCYRLLLKHEEHGNIVREVLHDQGTFYEYDHYPGGDVHDSTSHSQYFYHAHRGINGEHGHFHTFLRARGMPEHVKPISYQGEAEWPGGNDILSHLVAIGMDSKGYPIGLFTTNRWVTGENWYPASDVIDMLDRFEMDMLYPSWPVNIWISAMFCLFRPQIVTLLEQRDQTLEQWRKDHPDIDVYEDRELEITSNLNIDVERQIELVEQALQSQHSARTG